MAQRKSQLRAFTAVACCLSVGLLGGCRNLDNAQVDVLERELRQQEDYIYELEDYLIEYSEKLRHARVANCPPETKTSAGSTRTREALPEPTIDEDRVERPSLPLNGRNKMTPPTTEAPPADSVAPPVETEAPPAEPASAPATEPVSPEELEPQELQIGPVGAAEASPGPALADTENPAAAAAKNALLIPDPIDYQEDVDGALPTASEPTPTVAEAVGEPKLAAPQVNGPRLSPKQLQVRQIFLEPSEDGRSPGSLLVVVEGVNGTDEPVDVSGAASLMVMARDEAGALRRVDRWDFTAEETAAAWQSSHLGDGLHLELPLTKSELPPGELELWARVVDNGGAKLLTPAEEPYRFETDKLVAMADAPAESMLADADGEPLKQAPAEAEEAAAPTDAADQPAEAAKTVSAEAPQPQWRASTVRLGDDRAEGFATTAGNKPASWTTTPIQGGQPRIASATGKTSGPTWKRSTRAAVATESKPEWSSER